MTLTTALPLPALAALSESKAIALIDEVMGAVHAIIDAGGSQSAMVKKFEKLFADYAAVELTAKAVLGAPGRQASSSELKAYINAFQIYMARKYGPQFERIRGAKTSVKRTKDAGSKGFLITTWVDRPTLEDYELEWWVIEYKGQPRFFDVKIEGISLISTERTEIGAIFESVNGDFGKLVERMLAV